MTMNERPTVALVDWHWTGHHPTYFRKLLLGFHACGARVLAMCPASAIPEMTDWLQSQPNAHDLAAAVEFIPARLFGERMRLPQFLRARDQGRRIFGGISSNLKQWERRTGNQVSLVFFATIYDFNFENFHYAGKVFSYPWSGIYLHARSFRLPGTPMPYVNRMPCPEKIFTVASMSSVCVIDEGAVTPMEKLSGGKPVFEFPDITDCTIEEPLTGATLAGKLKRFANGRPIVACLGHLQKTKGIYELCLAARDPRLHDVCFFFGGEVNWAEISREEITTIRTTWEQAPNVMTYLASISDATMNAAMVTSDVVFAAYTNFPNSSNVMTKAARFNRPIIVSDGFLMAERVRLHGTGRIVPEGDVPAIVAAILELAAVKPQPVSGYEAFYEKHSEETLLQVLEKVLRTNQQQLHS
jgi:hypothetical protein